MPSDLFGLPSHILLLHAVVVLIPLAAVATMVIVVWPRARERYGLEVLAFSFLATLAVPLTAQAGESLAARLPASAAIRRHATLGQQVTIWAAAFGILLAGVVLLDICRRAQTGPLNGIERWLVAHAPGWTRLDASTGWFPAAFTVVRVLSFVTAVGVFVALVRAGHSGATSVWSNYPNLGPPRAGS